MIKINNHNLAAQNINTRFLGQNWGNKGKKWLAVCGVAVFMLGGCTNLKKTTTEIEPSNAQPHKTTAPTTEIAPPAIFSSSGDPNFVVKVVQKVGGAVVRIDSTRTVTTQAPDEFSDPFFRGFFGNRIPSQQRERVERGSGSGFIINSGKVLGEDAVTDVAVIQIDANNLPSLALGKSDTLQPGEAVIAIGNPLGLNNTVTSGIISATDRSSSDIGASDKRVDYLQTDAAINPGNSGGPLLNARGEVIGMNTAIIQGAQGLGFAIPINTAQKIAEELIAKGRVDHPYLGIQMVTLTPEIKEKIIARFGEKINLSANQGILLVRIVPNSPAATAGLRPGDVIKSMNNQPVLKVDEVQRIVENSQVGIPLQVQVERNGKISEFLVKPAPLPINKEN
jgi:S1-C subfamily serine protease